MPTPDDMVAVLNLLDHMTSLLDLELEAERGSSSEATAAVEVAETNGGGEPNLDSLPMVDRKMPCLDLLLSGNILSHILATSRMPVSLGAHFRHFPIGTRMGARHLSREEGLGTRSTGCRLKTGNCQDKNAVRECTCRLSRRSIA